MEVTSNYNWFPKLVDSITIIGIKFKFINQDISGQFIKNLNQNLKYYEDTH